MKVDDCHLVRIKHNNLRMKVEWMLRYDFCGAVGARVERFIFWGKIGVGDEHARVNPMFYLHFNILILEEVAERLWNSLNGEERFLGSGYRERVLIETHNRLVTFENLNFGLDICVLFFDLRHLINEVLCGLFLSGELIDIAINLVEEYLGRKRKIGTNSVEFCLRNDTELEETFDD